MARKAPSLTVLVLAAGKGSRLRSRTIKLLHPVAGRPMVEHVLEAASKLKPARSIAVVGFQADAVREALAEHCDTFVTQQEQLGTGHAVLCADRALRGAGNVLILSGDLPTLRPETLRRFTRAHVKSGALLSVLTTEVPDASGYGRIVRDGAGRFTRIVEHKDASRAEREIREFNSGIYCAQARTLLKVLRRVRPDNMQGEYYITDAVGHLAEAGHDVLAWCHDDADEVLGVNTREELAAASRTLYRRKAEALQTAGVTLMDRERTWIDPRARIGRDTVIWPDVQIDGATAIGEDCTIRSGCRIADSRIGKGVEIKDHCVVLESKIGNGAAIGPFAHLRPGSDLRRETKVGNFVELKKTVLGERSKASHLTYLGDAQIGPDCNIGAGTITCNYDGTNKHRTVLGKGVFVGSNSQIVAPAKIGDRSYVAAGSTVTQDVPPDSLAVGRSRQRNVVGWVKKRKAPKRKH